MEAEVAWSPREQVCTNHVVRSSASSQPAPSESPAGKVVPLMSPHEFEASPPLGPQGTHPPLPPALDSMSVVIDGIIFSLQRHGGISVYFHQLLARLRRDGVRAGLTLDGPTLQRAPEAGGSVTVEQRPARLLERYRRSRLGRSGSLFHSSYYRVPQQPGYPTVVTVHDFTYERCVRGPRRWVHSAQKYAAIRQAQAVICVSEATREDLLELVGVRAGQQVHVVHNGVAHVFRPASQPDAERPFVLFVGQRGGYKNFRLVAQAMNKLPDIELSCVGGGALDPHELQGLPEATRKRIRHLGFVDDNTLNRLYNQAICLVYPSSYEGFGIPVVEAMKAGCPVVCIQCKAVVEIGGNALSIAEPDPAALANAIAAVASSPARATLAQAGLEVAKAYDWERTYRSTLQVYGSVAELA